MVTGPSRLALTFGCATLSDDHERSPEQGVGEVVFSLGLHHRQHGEAQGFGANVG